MECIRCVCMVCAVCYQFAAETMRVWMEDEFRLIHTPLSEQHAVWLSFVTQIQMWPPNKGSTVLCNHRHKADFLNGCLYSYVRNISVFFVFFMQNTPSFVFNNDHSWKTLTFWHWLCGLLAVCGKWTVSDWILAVVGMEIWFCPTLISCEGSWRKKKRWAARNNAVLSRAQLIVLIRLLQACHVPPAAWMEQIVRNSVRFPFTYW